MNKRRIMLYGGPGCGKSTLAHFLMSELKQRGIVCDMAREVIKRRAFDKTPIDPRLDQFVFTAKQIEEELAALATGAVVISDSPVALGGLYCEDPLKETIAHVAHEIEKRYPAVHILVARDPARQFVETGRWGSESDAIRVDQLIRGEVGTAWPEFSLADREKCLAYVLRELGHS